MAPGEGVSRLRVTVAYSPEPGRVDEVLLELVEGATLGDALRASRLLERHPTIDLDVQRIGIWGKFKPPEERLRDRDRIEIYRPLKVDPKEARRQRYRRQRDGT